jgi:hypothetical protein
MIRIRACSRDSCLEALGETLLRLEIHQEACPEETRVYMRAQRRDQSGVEDERPGDTSRQADCDEFGASSGSGSVGLCSQVLFQHAREAAIRDRLLGLGGAQGQI